MQSLLWRNYHSLLISIIVHVSFSVESFLIEQHTCSMDIHIYLYISALLRTIHTSSLYVDVDSKLENVSTLQFDQPTLLARRTQSILVHKRPVAALCVLDVELSNM